MAQAIEMMRTTLPIGAVSGGDVSWEAFLRCLRTQVSMHCSDSVRKPNVSL